MLPNAAFSFIGLLLAMPALAQDGTPDPAFGDQGAAFIRPDDVEARQLHPYVTAVLADGKLLFGGFRSQFDPNVPFEPKLRPMLARMNADGSVDATFGNTSIPGVHVLPDIAPDSRIQSLYDLKVLADGSIVAAGSALAHAPSTGFLVKLHADGSIDTTFGTEGFVRLAYTEFNALDVDSQGRIVVAGTNVFDFGHLFGIVARYTAAGAPDTTFATTGLLAVDWNGGANGSALDDVVVTADDHVIVGGRYDGDAGLASSFAVAKLDAGGNYDSTFATTGRRVFGVAGSDINTVQKLALDGEGRIAFAGQYANAEGRRALVLGRLNADGGTDTTFGETSAAGYWRPPVAADAFSVDATDLVVQPDGKPVAAATYYSPTIKKSVLVVRATNTGAPDATFGDNGVLLRDLAGVGPTSEAASLALQPDGKLIVAGAAQREEPLIDLAVLRLLGAGTAPDAIFADGFEPKASR